MASRAKAEVEKARKAGKCQRCGEKADPLYTVRFTDKARTKVKREKATADSQCFYCDACSQRRVKEYERTAKANAAKGYGKREGPAAQASESRRLVTRRSPARETRFRPGLVTPTP